MGNAATANIIKAASPPADTARTEWMTGFCGDYGPAMFTLGWWFVVAAFIGGALLALVQVYRAATAGAPTGQGNEGGGGLGLPALAGALKELIEIFTKAPTWLALFGAGVLLLWMAGNAVPDQCLDSSTKSSNAAETSPSPSERANATRGQGGASSATNGVAQTPGSSEAGGTGR